MMLTTEYIDDLFSKCFFKESEIVDGRPTGSFIKVVSATAINNLTAIFSVEHLNALKEDILALIDAIPGINDAVYTDDLAKYNWGCEEILDKIILMGLATSSLLVAPIQISGKNIYILKRDKSHDKEEITGLGEKCFVKTNLKTGNPRTQAELDLLKENREKITIELNAYLKFINLGFNFFGIQVELDSNLKNKLNFYDKDNNLIYEKKYEDGEGIIGLDGILNQRLKCEFATDNKKITYLYDNNDRHIFILNDANNHSAIRVEITANFEKYERIEVTIYDPCASFVKTLLAISDDYFNVRLDDTFGPDGNYVDGVKREIFYSCSGKDNFFSLTESMWPDENLSLSATNAGFMVKGEVIAEPRNTRLFKKLVTNLIAHPRNRETINYTLASLDKALPGIKDFILANYELCKYFLETPYKETEETEIIMAKVTNPACDFASPNERKLTR